MKRFRPTIRFRLTLIYGALFLAAGVGLLALNYTLVRQALPERVEARRSPFLEEIGLIVEERRFGPGAGPFPIEFLETADGRTLPDIFAAFEEDVQEEALDQLVTQSAIALALTGGAAVLLGWVVAGRALQPVHRITETARSASQSNLQARVDLDGPPDEMKELADTFDQMLARLETAFESQRRFAAQASHELRTPISVIRAEADVALAAEDATERERALALAVRAEADRSEALIDGLLALSRSESTLHDTDVLDLAELAGDVVGDLVPLADEHGVVVDLKLATAPVAGDRVLLERLISNLVTNAILHGGPDREGRRWIGLHVESVDNFAMVSVANSGPDLQGDDLESLFDPFQRRNGHNGRDRRGVGLGLAIVRAVARTHGGSVTLRSRVEGGLDVTVAIPLNR